MADSCVGRHCRAKLTSLNSQPHTGFPQYRKSCERWNESLECECMSLRPICSGDPLSIAWGGGVITELDGDRSALCDGTAATCDMTALVGRLPGMGDGPLLPGVPPLKTAP